MGVDILGVEAMRIDVLGVDVMALIHVIRDCTIIET